MFCGFFCLRQNVLIVETLESLHLQAFMTITTQKSPNSGGAHLTYNSVPPHCSTQVSATDGIYKLFSVQDLENSSNTALGTMLDILND